MTNSPIQLLAPVTAVLLAAAVLSAQAPLTPDARSAPRPNPQTRASTATRGELTVTLVGCVYADERKAVTSAGDAEDFILADATTAPLPAASGTAGATGTSGTVPPTGNMYEIENIPARRLKGYVGKRVEITGDIDPDGAPRSSAGDLAGHDLPEFEALSIRELKGTCPATPAPRR